MRMYNKLRKIGLATSLAAGLATGTAILASTTMLSAQTLSDDAFGQKVREYLLKNPQVILEAMELMSEQDAQARLAERLAPIYEDLLLADTDLVIGNKDANIKIIELFDYRCAVCKAMVPALEAFVNINPDVVIIKKQMPILSPTSQRASRYTLATNMVYGPEEYTKIHKVLYATKKPLSNNTFEKEAANLGLDHEKIMAVYNSDAITSLIDKHRDLAIDLEILGTPAFITASELKIGAVTEDDLKRLSGKSGS